MAREGNEKLKELFEKSIPVYSYSKLDTWGSCKYNYYQGYVLKNRSKDNIYSIIGGVVHDGLEDLYTNNKSLEEAEKKFLDSIKKSESEGIKFPENPPTTKINYLKNMNHFFNHYKKLDTKMITEQFVLLNIPKFEGAIEDKDFVWIQMYIDSIIPVYDEGGKFISVIVNDWKTSSKFDKVKLKKASRQLLLYKIGVEQSTNIPVSKLGWTMLKYVYCCKYDSKGNVKKSIQERKDSVKYFYKSLVKDLIKIGMDTMEAELLVGKCISQNSFEYLPKDIKGKYWIEDCFLECEFDDQIIEECKLWVLETAKEIERLDNNAKNYPPVEIGDKTSYFCNVLCGRPDCIHLLKFNSQNIDKFKKSKKEEEINEKIGKSKVNLDSLFL